ncbi:MAG: adenosylcobinamide-GDP ribazoletransferase [Lachnospiraceae bacterium]|nr:adenosylcobinamide-GDP ribazoletransferase [Lachnospiraceae bacterium]
MNIFRWFAVSFSLYSKIPMPRFIWKEDDMAHSLTFFPFVGVAIGAFVWLLNVPAFMMSVPVAVRIILTILAPLVITGGFHLDGFMDTEDALKSYAPTEKKLEILKDPHIGAFAVLGLVRTLLVFGASVTAILLSGKCDNETILIFASIFAVGRCLSGLTSLLLKKAKKDGMLYEETKTGQKGVVAFLIFTLIVLECIVLFMNLIKGLAVLLTFTLYTIYYRYKAYKEFGGVTGDTAGYFLTTSETMAAAVLAIVMYI